MQSKTANQDWNPRSWCHLPAVQQPSFPNDAATAGVYDKLEQLPPLVYANEVNSLRQLLAEVFEGKRVYLQGGDCAERFSDCTGEHITAKLKIMLQMSLVLVSQAKLPVVRITRMAGQYAKPRSSPFETLPDGRKVPSFRGDCINGFDPNDREHNPDRLLQAYYHSAATLNYIRALSHSGFAGLHHSRHWDLGYVVDEKRRQQYESIVERLLSSLELLDTIGLPRDPLLEQVDFYTSHEALVLGYESALTRKFEGRWYNTSAAFLWIGNRTRQLDHAHVEYVRGIENPIGIKISSSIVPEELVELIQLVEPQNRPGRVTLISRFGADLVAEGLPALIRAVRAAALKVNWVCDPMHGNTFLSSNNIKTRSFDAILSEIEQTFAIHVAEGSRLNGVHFELSGDNCTEVVGGEENLQEEDLNLRYTTYCDPRLNYSQSLAMSFRLGQLFAKNPSEYETG